MAATELYKLKEHATEGEFSLLMKHFETHLDPSIPTRCVYGLMTENCYSPRAAELMTQCAPKFFGDAAFAMVSYCRGEQHVISRLQSLEIQEGLEEYGYRANAGAYGHWSALEVALFHHFHEVKALIRELQEAEFPTA